MILWMYFLQLYFGPSEMEHPGVKDYEFLLLKLSVSGIQNF